MACFWETLLQEIDIGELDNNVERLIVGRRVTMHELLGKALYTGMSPPMRQRIGGCWLV